MKYKKTLILLLLSTMLLSWGGNALAATINATFSDIKLFLNGTRVDKDILLVEGSSYLPLRAISEALGLEVEWNGQENAIYLTQNMNSDAAVLKEFGVIEKLERENSQLKDRIAQLEAQLGDFQETPDNDQSGSVAYPGVDIEPFNIQRGDSINGVILVYNNETKWEHSIYNSTTELVDNLGNVYSNFIAMHLGGNGNRVLSSDRWLYIEFPTSKKFKNFKASLGLAGGSKNITKKLTLEIFADNKKVYSKEVQAGDFLSEIDIDITNADKLRIKLTSNGAGKSAEAIGLFNPKFIK